MDLTSECDCIAANHTNMNTMLNSFKKPQYKIKMIKRHMKEERGICMVDPLRYAK